MMWLGLQGAQVKGQTQCSKRGLPYRLEGGFGENGVGPCQRGCMSNSNDQTAIARALRGRRYLRAPPKSSKAPEPGVAAGAGGTASSSRGRFAEVSAAAAATSALCLRVAK